MSCVCVDLVKVSSVLERSLISYQLDLFEVCSQAEAYCDRSLDV